MCTVATGKKGKHWYEYRYAASSLGTLSNEFLRKFAWAVGGAAGQKGSDCDENAGSQHCEHEMDHVWCEDSYVTRPTERDQVKNDEQTRPDDVVIPPMKVIWPSDLQMKGMEPSDDESISQGSEPEWARDANVGRRIRQSFLLSGADIALVNVANEIEPVRADQQLYREGSLSHAKVLSCHLCSNASTEETDDTACRSSAPKDHNLAWLYIGSANLSAAAWGRPLNPTQKHFRDAAAGALDSAAVRHLETPAPLFCAEDSSCLELLGCVWQGVNGLPWWGKAGQGTFHIANWELGVVLRPPTDDKQPPLLIDWPYQPKTLRPYGQRERPALRSTLREIRSK